MTQDPYTSEQSKAQKPIDPIGSLVSHWLKILIFGMILFSLTAPLGIYMSKPFYDSVGKLRIAPVLPTLISRAEESSIISYYNDYVLTQIELIYEHDIIESSLENLDPELKKQFVPEGISISRAASMLAGRLQVSQIPETHIVQLYMDGDDPDGLAEIINSVMNAYLEKLRGEEEGKDNRRLTYLRQEKDKIENDIAKMTAQLQQITLKTGTSTINQGQNIFTQQLQDLQRTHSGAYEKRVEKESMYIKAVSEAKDMNLLSLAPVVNELVYRDPSIHETRSWTHKQIQEMEVSLEGATMDNPDRRFQDKRKKEMEAYLQELKSEVRIETTNILDAKRKFELRQRVINAKADYEAALQAEKTILDELERIKLSASEAAQLIFQGHQIGETLRQSRTLLDRLDDRIHEIKLESRAPGRVILESLARTPELASGNNKTKNLSILFIFSFFSITALTIIYDIFDDRITSVKDVTNALGFTPSWPISDYLITGDGKLEFSRVTIDDPQNVVSKAVRSLAVRLNREREEHDARVAVFTGVNDKSGNTSILINTAYAIKRFCGRVLVLEANFVSPDICNMYEGHTKTPCLIDIIKGTASIEECIFHDSERGIDILLADRIPTSLEESAMDNLLLLALLNEVRKKYDFILIDSAPVLQSDLTEFLVVQADVGVLIIQGDRCLYNNLRRSVQILSRLRLTAISAVFNWGAPRNRSSIHRLIAKFIKPIENRLPSYLKKIG